MSTQSRIYTRYRENGGQTEWTGIQNQLHEVWCTTNIRMEIHQKDQRM